MDGTHHTRDKFLDGNPGSRIENLRIRTFGIPLVDYDQKPRRPIGSETIVLRRPPFAFPSGPFFPYTSLYEQRDPLHRVDDRDERLRSRATSTSSPTVPQIGMANGAGYGILYPLSKNVKVIGLDVLDHLFFLQTSKSVSRADSGQTLPLTRCLDLGCGDTEFVGLDYSDVQPKLYMLPVKVAERVQWVHGNFLERLPFEDNSFDRAHIHRIAWGVPGQSWDYLCLEIEQILCPGGVLEWIEEDVLFPILPRSYTTKSKARQGEHQSRVSELTIAAYSDPIPLPQHLPPQCPRHN
ncbi:hypothetical protein M422DRAFT_262992 [Sphaerobolus stellatus SS14]|uniref:Unplaced genomic scaffold SPHSTscaffold_120, whole genome shotgun sequence n=1 Tax=Sphaerobolus stellatus (strain SS14) TaxID=990650 RepID=A0A0C9UZS1_SPHS4|nr:hypothetical protein M422DRAFT_262992 [Sphaerobolus stellatus SS14]